jgi:hypothetical protein
VSIICLTLLVSPASLGKPLKLAQEYSQVVYFTQGDTRFEIDFSLQKGFIKINESNHLWLTITPYSRNQNQNYTLDRIEVSFIAIRIYLEIDAFRRFVSDIFFLDYADPLVIKYNQASQVGGKILFDFDLESQEVWIGLGLDYIQYFNATNGEEHSASYVISSPKIIGPLSLLGNVSPDSSFNQLLILFNLVLIVFTFSIIVVKIRRRE